MWRLRLGDRHHLARLGFGGILGGVRADDIGRKRLMMFSIFSYALFTGMTAFAYDFTSLAVLRFITGIAIGSEWRTGIALVAETWPNRARPPNSYVSR